ncbi:MAG: hypothetical protein ACM3VT_03515 [Solirubrobacterales bacterium]
MSLPKVFQAKVQAVRVRCGVNVLLRQAGKVLAAAGVVAALAVLAERLLAVRVLTPWSLWGFAGVVVATVLVLWVLNWPTRMQASLLLDERLGLHERVSTTLAFAQSDDPFARAARDESLNVLRYANLAGHFPIKLSRSWVYGAGTWAATIMMVLLIPQKDLLGFLREQQEQQKKTLAAQVAQTQVKKATEKVKDAVRALGDPNLVAELKKLDELGQRSEPQEVKREAIKALGDLSDKLKQMQAGSKLAAADVLQQTLKQLRGSVNPLSQQLRMSLAKGDFSQAANMLAQLQSQLNSGTLSADQRKELAAQMQDLGKELQKLADQKKQLEGELAKLGLDKKLATANSEQLRQALQKQGLSKENIDQLMKKIEAGQAAFAQCSSLGQALGGAASGDGTLSAEGLTGAIDELGSLDALQQEAFMLEASLADVTNLMGQLGAGMSEQWDIGPGGGYGGKGIGLDTVDQHIVTSDPLAANKMAKAPSRSSGSGTAVASWYFRDTQIKGEAQRPLAEVVQAGRATAAEAISENQIPRRYEDAVKTYFNQLEQSAPKP